MKKRILIVDDESDYLHMIKMILEHVGEFQVKTVNIAAQTLYVAHDFQPDLVLLDCMMPGVDGGELAAELQADEQLKNTPFMFLTCTVSVVEQSQSRCFDGMQTFIPKNLTLSKLVELIHGKLAA